MPEGWFKVPYAITELGKRCGKQHASACWLYVVLLSYARDHDYCWPSNKRLADDTGMSECTVRRMLMLLEQVQAIRIERREGMARSGEVYPLHLPPELLEKAFQNTVMLLKEQVEIDDHYPGT